jgi:hypothetical protein
MGSSSKAREGSKPRTFSRSGTAKGTGASGGGGDTRQSNAELIRIEDVDLDVWRSTAIGDQVALRDESSGIRVLWKAKALGMVKKKAGVAVVRTVGANAGRIVKREGPTATWITV